MLNNTPSTTSTKQADKPCYYFESDERAWVVNGQCRNDILEAIHGQMAAMLSHHSKLTMIRLDLRLSEFTDTNKVATTFSERLTKWIKRDYQTNRVGYTWARELERAKKQHYHFVFFIDGHKVNNHWKIGKKAIEIGDWLDCSAWVPENPTHHLQRGEYHEQDKAFYRASYLAKYRGKGQKYRPAQTKDYGASRIAPTSTKNIKTIYD